MAGPGKRVKVALDHVDHHGFDGDPAVLAALAVDVADGAVVGAAKVTDVGALQFIGAQPGQQRGEDQAAVALPPVVAPPRLRVGLEGGDQSVGSALGSVLPSLGRPTICIGLDAISSDGVAICLH